MSSVLIVIQFVFGLVTLLFLLRFLLQAARADFYNQISQSIVKGTDLLCKPLRTVLRPYRNFDFASLVVAWLISALSVGLIYFLTANAAPPILAVLWAGLIQMLLVLTQFYFWAILIIVIASFLAQGAYHPALLLLHQLVEPIIAPVRKILPTLGPLDLSPMVVILIIYIVEDILRKSF